MDTQPEHLIIVCCHAIWLGTGRNATSINENEWLIQPFQRGETSTFIEHIKAGCQILKENAHAFLIFSGGPTRKETRLSEAESYHTLAVKCELLNEKDFRVACDTLALDSYQNLLFSIIKFRKLKGGWPKSIHIITHDFKRARFLDLHCKAIKFNLQRVSYLGIDPPSSITDPTQVIQAEKANGFGPWEADLYGHGKTLTSKRVGRDPWAIQGNKFTWMQQMLDGLGHDADIIKKLLLWSGGQNANEIFPEELPWK